MMMVLAALGGTCGVYFILRDAPHGAVGAVVQVAHRPAAVPTYASCDESGCCDEIPSFCMVAVPAFADSCGYESIASRCGFSCGRCNVAMPEEDDNGCTDELPTCTRMAKAVGDAFCELDIHRTKCRKTCGTCGVTCEDSRSHKGLCARAQQDLRRCAAARTAEACPETCGRCASIRLPELLSRQKCEDPPECAPEHEQQAADAALARFRACEDFPGSCGFTKDRPDHAALCAAAPYRDVLCRATCQTCPDGPQEPLAPVVEPELPDGALQLPKASALWPKRKASCSDVEARTCPRKCGVCKPRGSRSDWDVSNADRLVATPGNLRSKP